MIKLVQSLRDYGTEVFAQTLKQEIHNLGPGVLPLQQGVSQGGFVDDSDLTVTVSQILEDENLIHATLGIFFTEIVINCGCGADPMPQNAYCELQVAIDKKTAEAQFAVIQD